MADQTCKALIQQDEESYGDSFRSSVLEQYKVYVQSAENVSARRVASSRYLLALNAALVALYGVQSAGFGQSYWTLLLVPLIGLPVSLLWYRIIKSHADLNSDQVRRDPQAGGTPTGGNLQIRVAVGRGRQGQELSGSNNHRTVDSSPVRCTSCGSDDHDHSRHRRRSRLDEITTPCMARGSGLRHGARAGHRHRNPPPPSFPRRACPVLDTGRESIPGMVRRHNPGSSPTRRPSILGGGSWRHNPSCVIDLHSLM